MREDLFDSKDESHINRSAQVFRIAEKFGLKTKPDQEIEFFFYAKTQDDASNLAIELNRLGYNVEWVDRSAGDKDKWLVSGWTQGMNMDEDHVIKWSEAMDKLANEHDCLFDGWGTFVEGDASMFDKEIDLPD
jgi:regulator of RNase E activity RraB